MTNCPIYTHCFPPDFPVKKQFLDSRFFAQGALLHAHASVWYKIICALRQKKQTKKMAEASCCPPFFFTSAHVAEWVFWPISSLEKTFQMGLYCFYKMFLVNRAACDVAVNHIANPLQAEALKPNQFLLWAQLITLQANAYEDAKNTRTNQLISDLYAFLFVCLFRTIQCLLNKVFNIPPGQHTYRSLCYICSQISI